MDASLLLPPAKAEVGPTATGGRGSRRHGGPRLPALRRSRYACGSDPGPNRRRWRLGVRVRWPLHARAARRQGSRAAGGQRVRSGRIWSNGGLVRLLFTGCPWRGGLVAPTSCSTATSTTGCPWPPCPESSPPPPDLARRGRRRISAAARTPSQPRPPASCDLRLAPRTRQARRRSGGGAGAHDGSDYSCSDTNVGGVPTARGLLLPCRRLLIDIASSRDDKLQRGCEGSSSAGHLNVDMTEMRGEGARSSARPRLSLELLAAGGHGVHDLLLLLPPWRLAATNSGCRGACVQRVFPSNERRGAIDEREVDGHDGASVQWVFPSDERRGATTSARWMDTGSGDGVGVMWRWLDERRGAMTSAMPVNLIGYTPQLYTFV